MKLLIKIFFLLFFISSHLLALVDFTKEESQWIQNNPVVKFGADYRWPPFDFADAQGKHTGLASEYIKLISKKSGLDIHVETGIWSDILNNMKLKKYDGLACAVETQERKKYLKFTKPYLLVPMVIVTRDKTLNINKIEDLLGKVVSINKGSYIEEWLKNKYPKIKLHLTTSNEASLEALSLGEVDAYVGNQAVATFIINKNLLNNLQITSKLKDFDTAISVAIDKDKSMLFNIIQKSLDSITTQEHQAIKQKWSKTSKTNTQLLAFTPKQQEWIQKHKRINYVIDNAWKPIEYLSLETNKHSGITSSYIELVSQKTGIDFSMKPSSKWTDSIEMINSREADMYACVSKTDKREEVVDFSVAYLKMPQVFVTNKEANYIADIKELYGKKLVLIDGYSITEKIEKKYPKIEILKVEKITDAFKLLTDGKAYAYIDTLPIVSYYIQKRGYSNLKISGMSGYEFEFSMALRNDWGAEGIEIINKALASITEEEKNKIYNKWLHVEYDKEVDYTLIWQISLVILFFIVGTLYWNRKLSQEVQKRKIAQAELQEINKKLEIATSKANSASRAKSDFLSNMSHEIRTPMNAILGFAELLDEKIEDKKLKSFVKTIRSSGETLLSLINDILDLSKIESGKLEITKTKVNITSLFQESVNLFELQAASKGIELELFIDENLPSSLLLDAVRFKEILINLIGNAIKFTHEGSVRVSVVVDKVYEHESKVDVTFRVEDSGIGIAESNLEKIFNVFGQAENQDVRKYGGTGLGLAICRKLALLMNGSLEVESEVGVGSVFIVSLKNIDIASLGDEELGDEASLNYESIEFANATLLVVDDVEENTQLIKESFSDSQVKIIEASNGKEAIDLAKNLKIDLILMDIRMPIMDGYSATKIIKGFSSVPVVALTASIMQDEVQKLEGEKFDGYLRKPVTKYELFKEVSKFLKHKSIFLSLIDEEKKNSFENDEDDENIENIRDFITALSSELEELYHESIVKNDLSLIKKFGKKLMALSLHHHIKTMTLYAELLLEKVDTFEIDTIGLMLSEYKTLIEDLKSKL